MTGVFKTGLAAALGGFIVLIGPAAATSLEFTPRLPIPPETFPTPAGFSIIEERKQADGDSVAAAGDVRVVLANDGRALYARDSGAADGKANTLVYGDERGLVTVYDDANTPVSTDYGVSGLGNAVFRTLPGDGSAALFVRRPGEPAVKIAEDPSARDLICGTMGPGTIGCSVSDAGIAAFSQANENGFFRAFTGDGEATGKLNFLDQPDDTTIEAARITDEGRVVMLEKGRAIPEIGLSGADVRYRLRTDKGFQNLLILRNGEDMGLNEDLRVLAPQFVGESSLTLVEPGVAFERVDDSGPFNRFRRPNVNDFDDVAFLGEYDLDGAGVFTGFDPVANALLVEGDVFRGEMVTEVSLAAQDALNVGGQIGFSINTRDTFGRDSLYVLRAEPLFSPALLRAAQSEARISIVSGQELTLSRTVSFSASTTSLSFDLNWLFGDALLEVLLDDTLLDTFDNQEESGTWTISDFADPPADGSETALDLTFRLSGGDAVVDLDQILFGDALIGDFETGGFEGWALDGDGFARVAATAYTTAPVPLPGSAVLLCAALMVPLHAALRRKRARR